MSNKNNKESDSKEKNIVIVGIVITMMVIMGTYLYRSHFKESTIDRIKLHEDFIPYYSIPITSLISEVNVLNSETGEIETQYKFYVYVSIIYHECPDPDCENTISQSYIFSKLNKDKSLIEFKTEKYMIKAYKIKHMLLSYIEELNKDIKKTDEEKKYEHPVKIEILPKHLSYDL